LGAVCGLNFGEMGSKRSTRKLLMRIGGEGIHIVDKLGIELEKVGRTNPRNIALIGNESQLKVILKHIILRIGLFPHRRGKSSSLQSLERGRKTEIDFLNGYLSKKGKDLGIPTPLNDKITQLIKEIERGNRSVNPQNLLELLPF
jgi:2-dehydropantoate 2-reductase